MQVGVGDEAITSVTAILAALPHAQGWELRAYRRTLRPAGRLPTGGLAALISYQPTDGRAVATSLPNIETTGPVSLALSGGTTILRPQDPSPGAVITADGEIHDVPGLLHSTNVVLPGPDAAHCSVAYVDRETWSSAAVPIVYLPRGGILLPGVISPDGTTVAMADFGGSGANVYLLDIATGVKRYPKASLTDSFGGGSAAPYSFTPDGRYLMVAGDLGVVPVDVTTGKALPVLQTGPVDALAVEPIQ